MYVPSGESVYSSDDMSIWYLGNSGNDFTFAIYNGTNHPCEYTLDHSSVNEWSYEITDYTFDLYDEGIMSGCYDTFTFSVDRSFLKEHEDLTDIASIEFDVTMAQTDWDYSGDKLSVTSDRIIIEK